MLLRRCAVVFLEPRESVEFDLASLLSGGHGLKTTLQWLALAPHVGEVAIEADEREVLGKLGETHWVPRAEAAAEHGEDVIARLLAKGLAVGDGAEHAALRERDDRLRDTYWKPLSAAAHFFSRWESIDSGAAARESGLRSTADLAVRYGPPPPHFHARADAHARLKLAMPTPSALDDLLSRRTTCRNFETARPLDAIRFAHVLHTVYAAQAAVELAPQSAAVKKTSPSGGSLHPTEAYLLVRNVEGVAPGLYHYHSGDHALEPLPVPEADLAALAQAFVAGQHWFAEAHVLVILAPRFKRSFWKYRNHAKAYRAMTLDIGHLSQTLYLAATEHGLGAFITSAINEIEIERAFGLDPLDEGPLAVCGFGWRGSERVTVEFDPLQKVWPDPQQQSAGRG